MLGMFGIIIQDDSVQNTVRITQEVKAGEKYMVQFLGDPQFARVCQVEEIQTWLLFPNQKAADNWLQKSVMPSKPAIPSEVPPGLEQMTPEKLAAAAAETPPEEPKTPMIPGPIDAVPPSDVPGDPDAQTNQS